MNCLKVLGLSFALVLGMGELVRGDVEETANKRSALEVLPGSATVYLEVKGFGDLMKLVSESELSKTIQALPQFRQEFNTKILGLKFGLAIFEQAVGMKWDKAMGSLTAGGMYVTLDVNTNVVCLMMKADDGGKLKKIRDGVLAFIRADADRKGNADPIIEGKYRGIKTYQVGAMGFATAGKWLLACSDGDEGEAMLDRLLDGGKGSLGMSKRYQAARKMDGGKTTMWGYVDLEAVRKWGKAEKLFVGKTDNPAAEMLVGGIMGNLKYAKYGTVSLNADMKKNKLTLRMALPHNEKTLKEREFFFGAGGEGKADEALAVKDTAMTLTMHRDTAEMWLSAEKLFDERVVAQMTKSETDLGIFFSGRKFGAEILPAMKPKMQIVVSRQRYKGLGVVPAIKLPAFALIARVNDDAKKLQRELEVGYKSLMGLLNLQAGMQDRPQFDVTTERVAGGGRITTAEYLEEGEGKREGGEIYYNFSPTMAAVKDYVILASTKELGRELLEKVMKRKKAAVSAFNTEMRIYADVAAAMLRDNRNQLIAQNQLNEGQTKEEATDEIDGMLKVLEAFKGAAIELKSSKAMMRLEVSASMKEKKVGE